MTILYRNNYQCVSFLSRPILSNKRKYNLRTQIQCSIICTHDGKFHCDEALACWLLKQTSKFENAEIVRSRNPDQLKQADVVVDVGGKYSPDEFKFDHHQDSFNETFNDNLTTKLSSAGLVYKHFGREVISNILKIPENDENMDLLYLKMYKSFIHAIDAIDNGINNYEGGTGPLYFDNTNLSCRVNRLNPHWLEDNSPEFCHERFLEAVELTGSEFQQGVQNYYTVKLPAKKHVQDFLKNRDQIDSSGEIIKLDTSVPWKQFLYECEKEMKIVGQIKYCLYQDKNKSSWKVQAVGVENGGFENRLSLPEPWRGKNGDELSEVVGVQGCTFVHAGGFIGGNETYDGVLEMARKALIQGKK
eukprot:TRINITY_DN4034_c0_g3_i2.p1 TRINITY_DN4034_c0_g3~~TRINITY_DN4034_c0_g3_i2.p1  ORF type:complete len:360 (-),score=46.31 TRINITY_DN4034_c0_g3_i2:85-1164(-)